MQLENNQKKQHKRYGKEHSVHRYGHDYHWSHHSHPQPRIWLEQLQLGKRRFCHIHDSRPDNLYPRWQESA